jgi:hypothetical protein
MKKIFNLLIMVLSIGFEHYVIRPGKAIGAGLSAFSNAMGTIPGTLTNTWTNNQNCDAPSSTADVTVAVAGTKACNGESGKITITGLTAAAGATEVATITNTKHVAGSKFLCTLNGYTGAYGANGEPLFVSADDSTPGTIIIRIMNTAALNALSGDVTLSYLVNQIVL